MNLNEERRDYEWGELIESNLPPLPFELFGNWLKTALEHKLIDATAMSLITADPYGFPSSRIVLLKDHNDEGFTFFTNYDSNKGTAIAQNNRVGLHFFWAKLERQIRITGRAEKTSRKVSEDYFLSRPTESQIAAIISEQSKSISSRQVLEEKYAILKGKVDNGEKLQCPESWGGYLVKPIQFEFWQGRSSRLHDRIVYECINKQWHIKRLAP